MDDGKGTGEIKSGKWLKNGGSHGWNVVGEWGELRVEGGKSMGGIKSRRW